MPSTNPIDLKHKSCKQPQLQNFEPASDTPTIISINKSTPSEKHTACQSFY